MKTLVAKNNYYELSVDETENRIYFTLIGFWSGQSVVPNYINDIFKSTQKVTPGFTILSDLRAFKTPAEEVANLHKQAQDLFVKAGLGRTAELLAKEMVVENMTVERLSKASGMKRMAFHDVNEALKWLNSK